MELWHAWASPDCMLVRAALAEKGLPYRSHELEPGERAPPLGGRNAQGAVPVLRDGDGVHLGRIAIVDHLSARWPEPPLFPAAVGRDAVVSVCELVDRLFGPVLPRIDRGTAADRAEALGEARRCMADLDGGLDGPPYLLAEFSLADLALAAYMARLPRDWRPAPLGYERLARWEQAVMSRPSVREAMGPRLARIA